MFKEVPIAVGDLFEVLPYAEPTEFKAKDGLVIARYLPGYTYRVTDVNMDVVKQMMSEGKITMGGTTLQQRAEAASVSLGAVPGKVDAKVDVT